MINFTLRLRENEAEALDRLAYVYGVSKNRLLNSLIADEYESGLYDTDNPPADNELIYFPGPYDFAYQLAHDLANLNNNEEWTPQELRRIIKCFDYAIEHTDDPIRAAVLEEDRGIYVEDLKL